MAFIQLLQTAIQRRREHHFHSVCCFGMDVSYYQRLLSETDAKYIFNHNVSFQKKKNNPNDSRGC
jgi:hypothetical protein